MTNSQISKILNNVATSYQIKDENKYRFQIIAYKNAAEAIKALTIQVEDLYKENKLNNINGVGPTIKQRLEELLKNGHVKHFDEVMKDIPPSVFVLMEIPGFGPKKANKLSVHFNLNNPDTVIEDLSLLAKENKIAKLEGFGEKSQADIIRAINEYKQGMGKTTKMLLPYAYEIANEILEYLKTNKNVKQADALGSLRRMKSLVGDIDIAVASNYPENVINHFVNYPRKDRVIEKGNSSASILTTGGNQVDLMVQPPKSFGSLLQHFTGSKKHNIHLREYALKKNLSLSEKGIKNLKTNRLHEYNNEKDFYGAIGLIWIPPEIREDLGEIELAIKNKLPKLVELKDVKGEFHIHSNFQIEPSHDLGKNSIEEMILKAKILNYEYLGFAEHNPSQAKHTTNQIVNLIKKRNEEINNQSKKHNFPILKLMETDILPDGSLALPEQALNELNATIVSIHSVFNINKDHMTKRIIKGLSHPKAKILAHPTGRILNERNGYEIDYEKLFKFCIENNKALEINSFPTRLDLPDDVVRLAIKSKVKLVLNTDSHAANHMDLMKYGISQARRGWVTTDDIINSLSYNNIINWLSQ